MMLMKRDNFFVISLIFILFSSQTVSANDSGVFNPFDLGSDMVKDGLKNFIIGLGDEAYRGAGVNGTEASMNSYVTLSTLTFDPFTFPKVKELNYVSAVVAFLFILLYIGAGAAWAVLCRVSPNLAMTISEITDIDRDIAGKAYVRNIATTIVMLLFAYAAIRLVLVFNFVLSSLISKYIVISTVPASSNFLLYLLSGLVFLANILFYTWRIIVISAVASFALIIGAMLIWGYTRNFAISIIKYFIAVTFLQVIVVAIIGAGMIALDIIEFLALPISPLGIQLPALILIVVLIMSFFASAAICFGPFISSLVRVVIFKKVMSR
jgi:hypothetical protein